MESGELLAMALAGLEAALPGRARIAKAREALARQGRKRAETASGRRARAHQLAHDKHAATRADDLFGAQAAPSSSICAKRARRAAGHEGAWWQT